jgi:hypothetical protein
VGFDIKILSWRPYTKFLVAWASGDDAVPIRAELKFHGAGFASADRMMTLKSLTKLVVAISIGLLAACNHGNSPAPATSENPDDSTIGAETLGYDPQSRWPRQGKYSYRIEYSHNGVSCRLNKTFTSQAAYCVGLQDQAFNEACALPTRQERYRRDCGKDFQQFNYFADFVRSGYDGRLERECHTGKPPTPVFRTTKDFCDFLKDETLHNQCFWDNRNTRFQTLGCKGEFSPEPAIALPPLPPQDPVTPPPSR